MSIRTLTAFITVVVIGSAVLLSSPSSIRSKKLVDESIKQKPSATPDYSRYPIVRYESDLSREPERQEKSSRYDLRYIWVKSRPHPSDGGVNLVTEEPAPNPIPKDAGLVVLGRVISSSAFLTEEKKNIYSEFGFQVSDILQQRDGGSVRIGDLIAMDRRGGRVRYPSGQELFYSISGYEMPRVGDTYLVFLKSDKKSSNYTLITAYEIQSGSVSPLDPVISAEFTNGRKKDEFLKFVKEEIVRSNK